MSRWLLIRWESLAQVQPVKNLIWLTLVVMAATGCATRRPARIETIVLGGIEELRYVEPDEKWWVTLVTDGTRLTGFTLTTPVGWEDEDVQIFQLPQALEALQFQAEFSLDGELVLSGLYDPVGNETFVTITRLGYRVDEANDTFAAWAD